MDRTRSSTIMSVFPKWYNLEKKKFDKFTETSAYIL